MEDQKKVFVDELNSQKQRNFDPFKALYNKNLEIKEEFTKRFQRDLPIDDLVDKLEVDISAF